MVAEFMRDCMGITIFTGGCTVKLLDLTICYSSGTFLLKQPQDIPAHPSVP